MAFLPIQSTGAFRRSRFTGGGIPVHNNRFRQPGDSITHARTGCAAGERRDVLHSRVGADERVVTSSDAAVALRRALLSDLVALEAEAQLVGDVEDAVRPQTHETDGVLWTLCARLLVDERIRRAVVALGDAARLTYMSRKRYALR